MTAAPPLSPVVGAAVRKAVAFLRQHPDAWPNTCLGSLLSDVRPLRAGFSEVRLALGLEDVPGALARWGQGRPVADVVAALEVLIPETGGPRGP